MMHYLPRMKPFNARIAIRITHTASVSLVPLPVKRYINATIAKNPLIILNAIKELAKFENH